MTDPEIIDFNKILDFIEAIEIPFQFQEIKQHTFLPGLFIEKGVLVIDKSRLKYIGDVLHEAGHIALMTPEERKNLTGSLEGQLEADATEMAVIAWTYAACLEIGIDPAVVFHTDGYMGGGQNIVENFSQGRYFGVPILQWYGMTNIIAENHQINYPSMQQWVR